jgi:TP901 family phage tail tape measure protein
MARTTNATANVTVLMNGESAVAMVKELTDRAETLRRRMMDAYKAGNNAFGDMLKKQLQEVSRLQRGLTTATYDYSKVLKNINGATLRDLEKTKRALRAQLQGLVQGTQQFIEKSKQLQQVSAQISRINGNLREQQTGWSRAANAFNKYFGVISSTMAAFAGVQFGLKKAKEEAAKMDDAYADVMKTTGMTKDEVLQLNEAFKKMDTRTGREQLNMLARDAGKLGVAKTDVLGFVEAGNQINVALGEDLGDDAIKNIGKIISVFEKMQTDLQQMDLKQQMLSIGSAINTLGQSSTASEPYMVEFTQRLSGVAAQAGLSIQNVLGFASALDQSGQAVEMSATSLQKFIMKLMEDPAKFARIAGLEVKQFTQLLNTDANAAIKTVLAALGEKGGFQQLIPIFKEMKMDGARAVGTLSALATNINAVDEAQVIANKSFAEAISLTNEYNIKNDNLQAKLDKARQRTKDLSEELGRKFQGPMFSAIKLWNNFLALIVHTPKEVYILLAAIAAYAIAVNSATVAKKAWILVTKAWHGVALTARLVSLAWAAGISTLTGNTIRATAAWKMFNASFNKTAIGAVITIIGALVIAMYKLATATSATKKIYKEFQAELEKERINSNGLFEALKRSNEGTKERADLLKKINEKYGEYLSNQLSEKSSLDDIAKAQREVNREMEIAFAARAKDKARQEVLDDQLPKQIDALNKIRDEAAKKIGKDAANTMAAGLRDLFDAGKGMFSTEVGQFIQSFNIGAHHFYSELMKYGTVVRKTKSELRAIDDEYRTILGNNTAGKTISESTVSNTTDPTDPIEPDEKVKKQRERLKILEDELETAHQKRLQEIEKARNDENTTEARYHLEATQEDALHYHKRTEALKQFLATITDEALKADVSKKLEESQTKQLTATRKAEEDFVALFKESRDKQLKIVQDSYDKQEAAMQKSLADEKITQEQYEFAMLGVEKAAADNRLKVQRNYQEDVQELELQSAELKRKTVEDANEAVIAAEIDAAKKRQKLVETLANNERDFKKQFNLLTLEDEKKLQLDLLENVYQARKGMLEMQGQDTTELTAAYELAKTNIIRDAEQNRFNLLQELGLTNWQQEYDMEMEQLQNLLDNKAITEEQYEKAKFRLRVKYAGKYVDYLAGQFSNAVEAIQNAETANVETNKEKELTALRQQREQGLITEEQYNAQKEQIEYDAAQKKLDIEKKYADVNFAIKVATIIASTAVAIMQGFAQLGPIGGAIAAVLMGVTAGFQIAAANAEREKVKSMTLDSPSSSSSTTQRVVLPGREEGGYTSPLSSWRGDGGEVVEREQDGRIFRARRRRQRGYVEEPTVLTGEAGAEFVVNDEAVANPTIRPVLDIIDIAQRNGSIGTINLPQLIRTAGYEQGGYTQPVATADQPPLPAAATDKALIAIITETRDLLRDIKSNGVKAPIVISEFEKKQSLLTKSRAYGTR